MAKKNSEWCNLLNQFRFRWPSFYGMCILLTHSSESNRFGRSSKPSTAKSGRFSRLSRDLRSVRKLADSMAKPIVKLEFKLSKLPHLMKPALPYDFRIFKIDILLNFEILFLEAYRFQNSEGL